MSPRLPSAMTSSPAARACATIASSASMPAKPRRSKHASCGLTATQAGPAASTSARQWARKAEPVARLGHRADRLRPEPGRVRVDAEHDLRLARRDRGGEAIPEGGGGGRRSAVDRQSVARAGYLTAFLRPEPAVNRGTLLAAICIVSPVRGLRPSRAPRLATWNLPNPVNETSSPDLSALSTVEMTASTAAPASFFDRPLSAATLSTNSDFVMYVLLRPSLGRGGAKLTSGPEP